MPVPAVSLAGRPTVSSGSRIAPFGMIAGWKIIFFSWVTGWVTTPARPTSEPVPEVVGTPIVGAMPATFTRVYQSSRSSKSQIGRDCPTISAIDSVPWTMLLRRVRSSAGTTDGMNEAKATSYSTLKMPISVATTTRWATVRMSSVAAIGTDNLVDVRSPDEYAGRLLAPAHLPQEQSQRGGPIPTARNIPWSKAANEDGTFKSDDDLRVLYGEAGLDGSKATIAYCRIGERSSHTWFGLRELLGH